MTRYFIPPIAKALTVLGWLTLAAAIVGPGTWAVTKARHAEAEKRAVCKQAITVLMGRQPLMNRTVPAPDPCRTLARMRGEE